MAKRLRDLIREIRAVRTQADERAVVQKECAEIREAFREEDPTFRCRNIAKLLYIHILGYPVHFGQLECLKLIASTQFTDKRMGYLGAMLLLDERQDVHLLVTNSLKNDLNHLSQYIVSLALCTLGSICSSEMSRDMADEVNKLLKSPNAYIKKKAALCAVRIVRKVPDLTEIFLPTAKMLLNEKNHGVLTSTMCLLIEMCERSPDAVVEFKKLVPMIVRILKTTVTSGYSAEHDVSGVNDPFLQVKLIRLLRTLGMNDESSSEAMIDILAQVATNTETSKSVGHAILYEIVVTVMGIKADPGLRVLAVNILGRFLLNSDRNIRYVALNTFLKVVHEDNNAVQRHRSIIVDCLKDVDITVKRRAMELCFALINAANVRGMIKELLFFLEKCDTEFKSDCASNVVLAAEKYAPNKMWYLDTVKRVLIMAGNYCRDDVITSLVQFIQDSNSAPLQTYAVQQFFQAMQNDVSQQPLVQVALWCVGEYGDLLVSGEVPPEGGDELIKVEEDDVLDMIEKVLINSITVNTVSKQYAMTAVVKLSARFQASQLRIRKLISLYCCSMNIELQQRSVEYTAFFKADDSIRLGLLEKIPAVEKSVPKSQAVADGNVADFEEEGARIASLPIATSNQASQNSEVFDLINMNSGGGGLQFDTGSQIVPPGSTTVNSTTSGNLLDLLDNLDIGSAPNNIGSYPQSITLNKGGGLFEDLLSGDGLGGHQNGVSMLEIHEKPAVKSPIPGMTAFDRNGLKIGFVFERNETQPTLLTVKLTAVNSSENALSDFLFQAAVPKTFQLQLQTPSGNVLPPSRRGTIVQVLTINNPQQQQLRMKLRLTYKLNGVPVTEQEELSNFPPSLWL